MFRSIPHINTSRLTLRPMRAEDFERFADIWTQDAVVRQIGVQPLSRAAAWKKFLQNAGQWQMTGFGQWAIEARDGKRMVGQVGFFHGCRDYGEDFDTWPEAGWVLTPDQQGKGLGGEAARAAHDWWDRVNPGPLVAQVTPGNAASLALAGRLGYRALREHGDAGAAVRLFRRNGPPAEGA